MIIDNGKDIILGYNKGKIITQRKGIIKLTEGQHVDNAFLFDIHNPRLLFESKEAYDPVEEVNEKRLYLYGKYIKHSKPNGNIRVYSEEDAVKQAAKYTVEKIMTRMSTGETDHPEYMELRLSPASILITELFENKGNFIYGKAIVLKSDAGNNLKRLLTDVSVGVSTRGTGTLTLKNKINWVTDWLLHTIDAVAIASAIETVQELIFENRFTGVNTRPLKERLNKIAASRVQSTRVHKNIITESNNGSVELFYALLKLIS